MKASEITSFLLNNRGVIVAQHEAVPWTSKLPILIFRAFPRVEKLRQVTGLAHTRVQGGWGGEEENDRVYATLNVARGAHECKKWSRYSTCIAKLGAGETQEL